MEGSSDPWDHMGFFIPEANRSGGEEVSSGTERCM